jgi:hypothetical protein
MRVTVSEEERKMSLNDLMDRLGKNQPGSSNRTPLEAEYERRKFKWQRAAVIIAVLGLVIATAGVIIAAAHLAAWVREL